MPDVVLSQSLLQNTQDSQLVRDPFQQAQNQYAQKQDQSGTVLSSSPFNGNPAGSADVIGQQQPLQDYKPMLQKLGINPNGIAMTEMGQIQLVGRLRAKFGDNLSQNKDATSALELFNKHLSKNQNEAKTMMNQSITNANRTLASLFGGSGV